MARKTKYDFYGDHFKATAVELGALPGVKATDVAKVLDIHPIMLYRWKKEYRDGDIMEKQDKGTLESEETSELNRLILVVFHLLFWRVFNWKDDLRSLSFLNKQTMQVLNLCLTIMFAIFRSFIPVSCYQHH